MNGMSKRTPLKLQRVSASSSARMNSSLSDSNLLGSFMKWNVRSIPLSGSYTLAAMILHSVRDIPSVSMSKASISEASTQQVGVQFILRKFRSKTSEIQETRMLIVEKIHTCVFLTDRSVVPQPHAGRASVAAQLSGESVLARCNDASDRMFVVAVVGLLLLAAAAALYSLLLLIGTHAVET